MKMLSIEVSVDSAIRRCLIYIESNMDLTYWTWTGGGGYSHTLPIRVCAAQRGRDLEAPDLERGIHFRGVL